MNSRKYSICVYKIAFFLFLYLTSFGQNKFTCNHDLFGRRVFIKNKSQFDTILPNKQIVDYVYSKGSEQVFFNKQGITYFLEKNHALSHSQHEDIENGKKVRLNPSKKAFVNVSWENSNPTVELINSDKQTYYNSYGEEKYKSECYKKITYKNIYKNIDIEYLLTDEKEFGIKYNIIVHPGGNINDVKIKYSGDVKKITLKKNNVVIKTSVFNITEIAPVSFQDKLKIESQFNVENNIISFKLPNNYNKTKELTIDPWVVNLSLPDSDYGYDVDYDNFGNYYVYGGGSASNPFLISKYSTSGSLQWTFSASLPSVAWGTSLYPSNFVIDKVTGKGYIGQGLNNNGTRIVRINTSGVYDNFVSTAVPNWREVWDMGYRCSDGAIIAMGGSTGGNVSGGILNTTSGTIVPKNFTGSTMTTQDVVSQAIDSNGNIFIIYGCVLSSIGNHILSINSSFSGNNWIKPSNYNTFSETTNKYYPGFNNIMYSIGYNALAANMNYLFYYDGFNLAAYNKTTGIRVAFTIISGLNTLEQGGIAVDECNNIYLGGNGDIKCYNFNGTGFIQNGDIPVSALTTNKYVTDIKLKTDSNELYVCGNGFGGIYTAINSTSCSNNNTSTTISQSTISPNNTTAIATVATSTISPLVTYTWFNSSNVIVSQTINTSSLINTVLNLNDGTYTLLVQLNAPCGVIISKTIIIGSNVTITPDFSPIASICSGESLSALPTISNNGITGTWLPALNNTQTTTYTFTPDVGQNASVANLTINVNPNIIPSFNPIPPICSGDVLSDLPTNSMNGFSGSWTPALNNTTTTTYTFTPNSGQCANTTNLTINVNPKVVPIFSVINPICIGDVLSDLPTNSMNGFSGSWTPALNNTTTTTYTFTPNSGQCANTTNLTINVNPKVIPIFTAINPICLGSISPLLPLTSINGIIGTWQPPNINNSSSNNYTFTPNSGQCSDITTINVLVNDSFDFEIKKGCVDKNFLLQVLPLPNTLNFDSATYNWKNNNNITIGSNSSVFNLTDYLTSNSIIPVFPMQFSVTVSLQNGCSISHNINVDKIYCDIQKGISPNGDNLNDFFDLELLDVKKLTIFNRYGTKIYSQINYKKEWIGQSDSGKELPDGTYYYVIEFNDNKQVETGWIYINRER